MSLLLDSLLSALKLIIALDAEMLTIVWVSVKVSLISTVIAGLAGGVIADMFSVPRSALKMIGHGISEAMSYMSDQQALAELSHQHAKEIVSARQNVELTTLRGGFAVEQELLQLANLIKSVICNL